MDNIKLLILLSGKRKSGKDFFADKLLERIGREEAEIIRISEPIKSEWATLKQLDLEKLLSDGPYKEKYRQDMIEWSDSVRKENYGFFCDVAIKQSTKSIVIVSDIRRQSDIKYFTEQFQRENMLLIRIEASEETRQHRGWVFKEGVDDVQSECDLDTYSSWDLTVQNNTTSLDGNMEAIMDTLIMVTNKLKPKI